MTWRNGDPSTTINVSVERTPEGLVHVAGLDQGEAWGEGLPFPNIVEAWYEEGSPVPVRIVAEHALYPGSRFNANLTALHSWQGPGALDFPLPDIGTPAPPSRFRMFPGEEEELFGLNYTPIAALDWLRNQSEEARQALSDGGCVVNFVMRRPERLLGNETLPSSVGSGNLLGAPERVAIALRAGPNETLWKFTHRSGLLNEGFDGLNREQSSLRHRCNTVPLASFADAANLEGRVSNLHRNNWEQAEYWAVDDPPWWLFVGVPVYMFQYVPDDVDCTAICVYHPERVIIRADNLLLVRISLAPGRADDIDALASA